MPTLIRRSAAPAPAPATTHSPAARPPQKSGKFVAGNKPRPAHRPTSDKAPGRPRQPQASTLTPELRAQIAAAFQSLQNVPGTDVPLDQTQANLNLRTIHTQISQQLWVKRSLVSQVLREVREALEANTYDLTPEQYDQATARYAQYVETGERPAGGRRRTIAKDLGVPLQAVVLAVRRWAQQQYAESPTPRPSRTQLFEIEKLYWKCLDGGECSYDEIPDAIAAQLDFVTPYQVLRWIDVLHDNTKVAGAISEVTDDQRDRILAAYREYLALPSPPERALHPTIAQTIGDVTPQQVHRVLYDYRVARRDAYRPREVAQTV